MNKYYGIGNVSSSFAPAAANDDVNFFFTAPEMAQVQQMLYPSGGTYFQSNVLLNGVVCGQRLEIHTPIVGKRKDSHAITLFKVAVTESQLAYAAQDAETHSVFPSNDFGNALNVGKKLIDRYEKALQHSADHQP